VVEPQVQGDFEDLLVRLGADTDQRLRANGGQLLSAAWCWPEERHHTSEGEVATSALAAWELADLDASIAALECQPALELTDPDDRDEPEVHSWQWISPSGSEPIEPPTEPGVRWIPCEEDAAEHQVRRMLGELIGEPSCYDIGAPDADFRWQRERWERSLAGFSPSGYAPQSLRRAA
jgi:hypothetical protein